jgi:dTDP-4-dehydrorhamnose 3,5-epimerase
MIDGVVIKELVTHADETGYYRKIIRASDECFSEEFGQWGISVMYAGVIKAWHVHKKQVDWCYVNKGVIKVALYDTRKDSPTQNELMELLMGDNHPVQVLRIPAGVAHGHKCISGPAEMIYITSNIGDMDDEERIAFDDKEIGYDWLKEPDIK